MSNSTRIDEDIDRLEWLDGCGSTPNVCWGIGTNVGRRLGLISSGIFGRAFARSISSRSSRSGICPLAFLSCVADIGARDSSAFLPSVLLTTEEDGELSSESALDLCCGRS